MAQDNALDRCLVQMSQSLELACEIQDQLEEVRESRAHKANRAQRSESNGTLDSDASGLFSL